MGSTLGSHAGGRISALHLHRLNKHVPVRGDWEHWESALSDGALAQATTKPERCLLRGDCQCKAAGIAKDDFPHKKRDWKPKKKNTEIQITVKLLGNCGEPKENTLPSPLVMVNYYDYCYAYCISFEASPKATS